MLTKRDFERIADDLRAECHILRWEKEFEDPEDGDHAANRLIDFVRNLCAKSNPNFDRDRFLARVNRE